MPREHIVKSYDEELEQLNRAIVRMGGMAEAQIGAAMQAVTSRDPDFARQVIDDDEPIDQLNQEIDHMAVRLLALRQPMAVDLRTIISAIRISADLERVADYAANIAKRSIPLAQSAPLRPVNVVPRMGRLVQHMLNDVLNAYSERSADKARAVWLADEEVDEMYTSLFRELLTYMIEDARNITPCTHLLFMAKNLERMGDHVTNVAENIYYMATGKTLPHERPRGARPEYRPDFSPAAEGAGDSDDKG